MGPGISRTQSSRDNSDVIIHDFVIFNTLNGDFIRKVKGITL